MRLLPLGALWAFGTVALWAQDSRLALVLERAAQASDAQKLSLPSFECREEVLSQHILKGKVDEEARMVATLRVQKDATGRLNESFESIGNLGARGGLPFYVTGGFGLALEYVRRDHQGCYAYELKGDRLTFRAKPHAEVAALGCTNPDRITGEAMVNADGDITHIERSVPAKQSYQSGFVPWAAIDLGAVELDGRAFRMSTHVEALSDTSKDHRRFEATYSGCKLFRTTVTFHGGDTVNDSVPK